MISRFQLLQSFIVPSLALSLKVHFYDLMGWYIVFPIASVPLLIILLWRGWFDFIPSVNSTRETILAGYSFYQSNKTFIHQIAGFNKSCESTNLPPIQILPSVLSSPPSPPPKNKTD